MRRSGYGLDTHFLASRPLQLARIPHLLALLSFALRLKQPAKKREDMGGGMEPAAVLNCLTHGKRAA